MPFDLEVEDDDNDGYNNEDEDNVDMEQDGDDNAGAGEDNPAVLRPKTRAELNQMRQRFENTMKLVAHLFHDLSLQTDLRMVSEAAKPLMEEYSKSLKQMSLGQAW